MPFFAALASGAAGAHSRVPMLAGSMAQEATGTPEHMNDATGQKFRAAVRSWGKALGAKNGRLLSAIIVLKNDRFTKTGSGRI